MPLNAKNKGASGEREFCEWLLSSFPILRVNSIQPERNLEQTRSGGADIVNVPGFVFEIKRVEKLSLQNWWLQVNKVKTHKIKVVAYRQNRQPWNFLISANHIKVEKGYIILTEYVFKKYAQEIFKNILL